MFSINLKRDIALYCIDKRNYNHPNYHYVNDPKVQHISKSDFEFKLKVQRSIIWFIITNRENFV
jgi:hypothetical protein